MTRLLYKLLILAIPLLCLPQVYPIRDGVPTGHHRLLPAGLLRGPHRGEASLRRLGKEGCGHIQWRLKPVSRGCYIHRVNIPMMMSQQYNWFIIVMVDSWRSPWCHGLTYWWLGAPWSGSLSGQFFGQLSLAPNQWRLQYCWIYPNKYWSPDSAYLFWVGQGQ